MSDLINRQAAIDAIEKLHGGCITDDVKNFVRYELRGVPSAQPEIIRCKDCKYSKSFDDGGIWCDRLTGTFKVESGGYCKWGKA